MHQWKEFEDEGGYASFGPKLLEAYQVAGTIAVRVLDGADPATIPVQPLTNIGLSINRATAERLGLPKP
jgi:putative tryptophan/tyrosine transport system substrate-binding protein